MDAILLNCDFGTETRADQRYVCLRCGRIVGSPYGPDRIHFRCGRRHAPKPGTELKLLLNEIGIKPASGCKCGRRARMMDTNGVEWCKANRTTIIGWLKEAASESSWSTVFSAAGWLITKGWFRSSDPYGSIVDEAIRRAQPRE